MATRVVWPECERLPPRHGFPITEPLSVFSHITGRSQGIYPVHKAAHGGATQEVDERGAEHYDELLPRETLKNHLNVIATIAEFNQRRHACIGD